MNILKKIENKSVIVGIVGMGYVGLPLGLAFAAKNISVLGFDLDDKKVKFLTQGKSYSLDPRIGLFMPCRVTVVEQNGVVKVMSINPKYQSRLFNNEELDRPCEEMYEVYKGILEDATI